MTVFPTIIGTFNESTSLDNINPSRLFELWRAVVTVDWTTTASQPASTATRASLFVDAGTKDAKHFPPESFIFLTTSLTRFSLTGAL